MSKSFLFTITILLTVLTESVNAQNCQTGVVNVDLVQCLPPGGAGIYDWVPDPNLDLSNYDLLLFDFYPLAGAAGGPEPQNVQMFSVPREAYPFGPSTIVTDTIDSALSSQAPNWEPLRGRWLVHVRYVINQLDPNSICGQTQQGVLYHWVEPGDTCDPQQGTGLYFYPETTSDDGSCNGTAEVVIQGGTPPYLIAYAGNQPTSNTTLTNLCAGVHGITVTDALGQIYNGQAVVTQQQQIYTDSIVPFLSGADTIFAQALENCDLDYTLPIDSMEITNAEFFFGDSMTVEWVVWQDGAPFSLGNTTYFNATPQSNVVSLTAYCLNGRSPVGSFQFFAGVSSYVLSTAQTEAPNQEGPLLYPNPTTDAVTIQLNASTNGVIEMMDVSGRVLQQQPFSDANQIEVDLNAYKSGVYLVKIATNEYQVTNRVIKR